MPNKNQIFKAREAVDAYREAHRLLHEKPWTRDVPEKHTPLLEQMLKDLSKWGFKSMEEFWTVSDDLNAQELGFKDKADMNTKAVEADMIVLDGKWK